MNDRAVERVQQEIRERVRERHGEAGAIQIENIERALTEARRLSKINAHWGISSSWPLLGRFEVLAKRAMRIGLRWYINPIVAQQNDFNLAVMSVLYELEAEVAAIRADAPAAESAERNGS